MHYTVFRSSGGGVDFPHARNCPAGLRIGGKAPWAARHRVITQAEGGAFAGQDGDETFSPELQADWRAFRAQLVAQEKQTSVVGIGSVSGSSPERWAHEISSPEKGCLLVARREDMGIFNRTVVLLLEHEDAKGTLGLILNQPSPLKLKENRLEGIMGTDTQMWTEAFGDHRMYLGGPVQLGRLNLLHTFSDLAGAQEVVKGVYTGGFSDACRKVTDEALDGKEFKLTMGCSAWGSYQLAAELHDQSWYVLAGSKDVILGMGTGLDADDSNYCGLFWEDVLRLGGITQR